MSRAFLSCAFPLLALLACGTAFAAEDKPGAPEVDVQIIPETEGVGPGESMALFLAITNRSAVALDGLSLAAASESFSIAVPAPPPSLPPFRSAWGRMKIAVPRHGVSFGKHQVPILLRYRWRDGSLSRVSVRTATAPIEVRRWLDEEAKGLPGGTAALFSLLFPIIPAFLAFQIVDRLRQKKGFQLPTFDSAYIVPAFFIALLVNSLPLFPRLRSLDLNPSRLVLLSLLLGALWPVARWLWDLLLWWLWGFRESDSPTAYLRKALFSPWSPRPYTWATGKVGEETQTWSGIFLRQPEGSPALGSILQIFHLEDPTSEPEKEATVALVKAVNEKGSIRSRCRLLWQVIRGRLGVRAETQPHHEAAASGMIVVAGEEIAGWRRTGSERKDLLRYSP